jgi:16S rRNA (uracil1498-N3)-methyltransferase
MKQFLLPASYDGGSRLTLAGRDFHYIARVLRLREGDELAAMDARANHYRLRLLKVSGRDCVVELLPQPPADPAQGGLRITLLQCLPKGRKIDLIVRQATEAGVWRIVTLVSDHCVVRAGDDDARAARLSRIAREAVQQSGAGRVPQIEGPRELTAVARAGESWGTALFFHERRLDTAPLHQLLAGAAGDVALLVGPEGGLSDPEVEMLRGAGFMPAWLGSTVLRVETAAVYALGAVITILQEKDAWTVVEHK